MTLLGAQWWKIGMMVILVAQPNNHQNLVLSCSKCLEDKVDSMMEVASPLEVLIGVCSDLTKVKTGIG